MRVRVLAEAAEELEQAGSLGAKRIILHRFPFSVVVLEREDEFVVVALAHFARRPGYWKERALT